MADAVFNMFPKAKYQVCLVHVGRNIAHKVRVEDRQEICEDFKTTHQATDAESARVALHKFCDKWGKSYKKVTQSLLENPYLLTFYEFPKDIWRSIYSTNLIESFNKQIKLDKADPSIPIIGINFILSNIATPVKMKEKINDI